MNQLDKTLIDSFRNFFLNPSSLQLEYYSLIKIFKIVFLVFGIIFLGYIIWALIFTSWLKRIFLWDFKEFITFKPYLSKAFARRWEKIKKRLTSGIEADAKLAILEADELLNDFLSQYGFEGRTLEEKIENLTKDILLNIEELKKAVRIKRAIVEDSSYKISMKEAREILEIYEKALKDLQAI
jgi:hypothetical protein